MWRGELLAGPAAGQEQNLLWETGLASLESALLSGSVLQYLICFKESNMTSNPECHLTVLENNFKHPVQILSTS